MSDVQQIIPSFPYGLDRPRLVRGLAAAGMFLAVTPLILVVAKGVSWLVLAFILAALACLFAAAGLMNSSRSGKVKQVDRALNGLQLKGSESALDLGCGCGLGCAALTVRLPSGSVTGVDVWNKAQMIPASKQVTKETLRLAGIKGVKIVTADVRDLPLRPEEIDLVFSRDCLSQLSSGQDVASAIEQISKVVKPGGQVLLIESSRTKLICDLLATWGFTDISSERSYLRVIPWARQISARKV